MVHFPKSFRKKEQLRAVHPSESALHTSPQHRVPLGAVQQASPSAELTDVTGGGAEKAINPITMTTMAKVLTNSVFIFETYSFLNYEYLERAKVQLNHRPQCYDIEKYTKRTRIDIF